MRRRGFSFPPGGVSLIGARYELAARCGIPSATAIPWVTLRGCEGCGRAAMVASAPGCALALSLLSNHDGSIHMAKFVRPDADARAAAAAKTMRLRSLRLAKETEDAAKAAAAKLEATSKPRNRAARS